MVQQRKLKLAISVTLLLTLGWICSGWNKVLSETYSEFVSGLMGVLVVYYTGNVSSKFVHEKYKIKEGESNVDTKS